MTNRWYGEQVADSVREAERGYDRSIKCQLSKWSAQMRDIRTAGRERIRRLGHGEYRAIDGHDETYVDQ